MTRTGATANSKENMILGEGILSISTDEGVTFTKIGATRGGFTFNRGRGVRDIEVDGVNAGTKGLVTFDEGNPTLSGTILEVTRENLVKLIPGASLVEEVGENDKIVVAGRIKDTDYIDVVRWQGFRVDSKVDGDIVQIDIFDCLQREPISLVTSGEEAEIGVEFAGHYNFANVDDEGYFEEPFAIEFIDAD